MHLIVTLRTVLKFFQLLQTIISLSSLQTQSSLKAFYGQFLTSGIVAIIDSEKLLLKRNYGSSDFGSFIEAKLKILNSYE